MDNNFFIPIGRRIAEIRKSHNMSQEKLAETLNLSPKHISHVERGVASFSLKNLVDFCLMFNTSLDYIILGKADNDILNKLPTEIIQILYTGCDREICRLNRYLEFYVELKNSHD